MSDNGARTTRTITTPSEMHTLAREVVRQLKPQDVVLLYGELGAGKTTFVQGLAAALGIKEPITSPTFTIVGEYATASPDIPRLIHADLYRLAQDTAVQDPAVRDLIPQEARRDAVLVVEWADRITWPDRAQVFSIHFAHGRTAEERHVTLDSVLVGAAS